jgi:hypothetical protein
MARDEEQRHQQFEDLVADLKQVKRQMQTL